MKITNRKYIEKLNSMDTSIVVRADGRSLTADSEYVLNLVRATGLKSKKRRHIEKRFKKILYAAILNYIEREDVKKTNNS